jgi:adenosylcobinamide amidohydrolase
MNLTALTTLTTAEEPSSEPAFDVALREPWLVISFGAVVRAASWAIVGGGLADTRRVVWLQVQNDDLRPPVDPRAFFAERLRSVDLSPAVGLLTSRRVDTYSDASAAVDSVRARCIATVGLGNALRAGDPPWDPARVSTINVLVHASVPLGDEALLEASALASEAKCAAMLEQPLPSRVSGRPATGTGTDCIVVTCPRARRGQTTVDYAGKHTAVGAAIGQAVSRALGDGIAAWRRESGL